MFKSVIQSYKGKKMLCIYPVRFFLPHSSILMLSNIGPVGGATLRDAAMNQEWHERGLIYSVDELCIRFIINLMEFFSPHFVRFVFYVPSMLLSLSAEKTIFILLLGITT